ncbi:MAG: autotransporter outer membrane beta-barrel domain-containing protein, partial [Hyphomicrobiales bacterium]|nr:autotransporter outer membrane beta-barrel domain-containing protein [Hyphomicrobiales bacterium]
LAGDIGTSSNANYYHGVRFTHAGTGDVTATLDGDIFVASGSRGLSIVTNPSADEATITVNGNINVASGTSNSHGRGISLRHGGRGAADVTVATGATITSSGTGILANANNGLKVTVDGTVDANGGNGISSTILGNSLNIYVNGMVSGSTGVFLDNRGTSGGEATLHVSGTITGDGGTAITTSGAGVSRILIMDGATINGLINTSAATGGTSIEFDASATSVGALSFTGATTLDIGGRTVGSTSGAALTLSGAGDKAITLGTGGSITGTIDASGATGAVNLDISGAVTPTSGNAISLGGASNHIVTLREGANIDGRIEKVSGATGNVEFRLEGDLTANPIVWNNGNTDPNRERFSGFGASDSILVADGARVTFGRARNIMQVGEIIHTSLNNVPLTLSGRLVFSGVFEQRQAFFQTINGDGGAVEIDVDFSSGDRARSSSRFHGTNLSGSRIPVYIRAVGLPELNEDREFDAMYDTDGDGAITIMNVISTFSTTGEGEFAFVAREWLDGGDDNGDWEFELVYDPSRTDTIDIFWSVVATPIPLDAVGGGPGVPAGPATLFDTLPAVLAHLGQPESMHRRAQNRNFQPGTGVWGKVQTGSLSVETTAAPFETNIRNVSFGIQSPIRAASRKLSGNVTLDANVTVQTATTEATIMVEDVEEKQDIQTNALIAGVGATWKRGGFYTDGQFQYARFDNDLDDEDDTRLASHTADSFTAGLEVGCVMGGGDLNLGDWLGGGAVQNIFVTPSAQVSWSQVGFSDFVATDGRSISLDDGTVVNGRVGAMVEANVEGVVIHKAFAPAVVRLQSSADVIVPLDGEVVTQVDGADQSSKREDPVFDLGVGVAYTWEKENHAYTLSADVSSLQGSEVDGYEANVGFKYQF